jgi:hypothetical protein
MSSHDDTDLLQRDARIEVAGLIHDHRDVRIFGGCFLDGGLPIGEEVGADEAADRSDLALADATRERMIQAFVEVQGALHVQRRSGPGGVVGVAAHGDVERHDGLAGGLDEPVVEAARRLCGGRAEQVAVEAFRHGILHDLGLRGGTEVGVEDLELETILRSGILQAREASQAIRVVDAFRQVADAVFLRRHRAGILIGDERLDGRRGLCGLHGHRLERHEGDTQNNSEQSVGHGVSWLGLIRTWRFGSHACVALFTPSITWSDPVTKP